MFNSKNIILNEIRKSPLLKEISKVLKMNLTPDNFDLEEDENNFYRKNEPFRLNYNIKMKSKANYGDSFKTNNNNSGNITSNSDNLKDNRANSNKNPQDINAPIFIKYSYK